MDYITKKYPNCMLFAYFIVFSLEFIKIAKFFAEKTYSFLDLDSIIPYVYDWIGPAQPQKFILLAQYIYFLVFLAIYALFLSYIKKSWHGKLLTRLPKNNLVNLTILTSFVLIYLLNFIVHNCYVTSIVLLLWVTSLVLFFYPIIINFNAIIQKFTIPNWFFGIAIIIVTAIFLSVFYPLVFKPMKVLNDYMDIPEKTILNNGTIVDNHTYINTHNIAGLYKYDPRLDNTKIKESKSKCFVHLTPNPKLEKFIYFSSYEKKHKYKYDDKLQTLTIYGVMSEKDRRTLESFYKNQDDINAINSLFLMSIKTQYRTYSDEEVDFIKRNQQELQNQAKAGWFFFHHSWLLNPLLAIHLGAEQKTQPLIYGIGAAWTVHELMIRLNDINYHTYFKIFFSFYPLYFLMFLLITYAIFKRLDYVLIAAMLLSILIYSLKYQIILLAPGYNPIRHFCDILCFFMFFMYVKQLYREINISSIAKGKTYVFKNSLVYLYITLLLGVFCVFWAKELGVFLLISIAFTSSITTFLQLQQSNNDKLRVLLSFFGIIVALIFGLWIYALPINANHNILYMLLGYSSPITKQFFIIISFFSIAFISIAYGLFANLRKIDWVLFLLVFVNFAMSLLYFLWNPSPHHLLVIFMPSIIALLSFYNLYQKKINAYNAIFVIISALYIVKTANIWCEIKEYNNVFKNHITYNWQLEKAKFITTMEPDLFKGSVALIQKYNQESSMYMISKYDSLLTMLTNKYNALHSVNVALDLIAKKDLNRFISKINNNKPKYIFIDKDLESDAIGEISNNDKIVSVKESWGRVSMLKNLQNFVNILNEDYKPIDTKGLLTVYVRKN